MPLPKRIQRKRSKGWRMPEGVVYVGRPSVYGNPFGLSVYGTREAAVEGYRTYLKMFPEMAGYIERTLRGKNLACWCRLDQPCHADVVLEVANAPRG
jgi:hypothetical protein